MMKREKVEITWRSIKGWLWTLFLLGVDAVMLSGGASTTAGINILAFIISMTGSAFLCVFGEWIVRRQYHAVKTSNVVGGERLERIFSEVQTEAAKVNPYFKIWPAEVYVVPGQEINAFAAGSSTVMITEASLQLDAGYQKALLAHELGHLAAGHGCMSLMIAANIMFLSVGYLVTRFIAVVVAVILSLVCFSTSRQGLFSFFAAGRVGEVVAWVLDSIQNMYVTALDLVVAKLKRGCEYDADWFAARCGYGRLLRQVLMQFAIQEPEEGVRLRERLFAEHPGYEDRIRQLTAMIYNNGGT